jgi:hypothetical protein
VSQAGWWQVEEAARERERKFWRHQGLSEGRTCADIRPCLWPRFGILGLQKPLVAGFLVWLKNTGMLNATGSFEVEGTWYHRDFIKARKVMKVMCPSNEIYYYLTILPLSGCVS